MKKGKLFLPLVAFTAVLFFSSFRTSSFATSSSSQHSNALINYAWYTPDGEFIAYSTLVNAEIVTDANTDPTGGTLVAEGYTDGGYGEPPVGAVIYSLYTH